jgi:single-strand DNA-binding protein
MNSTVTLVGNLVRTPEQRVTHTGTRLTTFTLAVDYRRDENRTTSYFDIVAFGPLAERLATEVAKGERLIVVGRLEQRSWQAKDGSKRSTVEVIADDAGPSLRFAYEPAQEEPF